VHVFVSRDVPASLRESDWSDQVEWVTLPVRLSGPPLHVLAQFAALPPLARLRGLDVLHSPANTGPAIAPGLTSVISLLDLIWLHRGDEWESSAQVQRRMGVMVRHCLRHVDRVFAISHAAAKDFVDTLGIARERIDVTPLGVREPTVAASPERDLRERLQLGGSRILLCVAQKRRYKNLHTLVQALPELPEDVVLVLPGSPTDYERELREQAARLGVGERVRFPDWLSDEDLEGLYALADAFVLPSLIEGFGIPVLEAMIRGVPVACANVAALPEVAGDAALLFDPGEQLAITHAIRRLLEDRALARRLSDRGYERAREFTWRRTGEASLAGYRRAMSLRR
jgi:glycosyltransferase involved in cell wall biosynthesis